MHPETISTIRREYFMNAPKVGSIEPPEQKTILTTTGRRLLVDKLGERLAFERTGVRLYEAVILKCGASALDLPTDRLREIRDQEIEHFFLLQDAIRELGADPTVQTPCADVIGVASAGLLQVVTDSRTDMAQTLNAILTAELTDNAGWELLIELCLQEELSDLADRFRRAYRQEAEHLTTIKSLLTEMMTTPGRTLES